MRWHRRKKWKYFIRSYIIRCWIYHVKVKVFGSKSVISLNWGIPAIFIKDRQLCIPFENCVSFLYQSVSIIARVKRYIALLLTESNHGRNFSAMDRIRRTYNQWWRSGSVVLRAVRSYYHCGAWNGKKGNFYWVSGKAMAMDQFV